MTTAARPGTPFPHTHILHHSTSHSTYSAMSAPSYFTLPIHFSPRALPVQTPPSLLKRSGSSSSSTSSHARTPSLVASSSRRDSSTSTVTSPSPRLQTPTLDETTIAPHPTPLELPSPMFKRSGLDLPPPEYNWTEKEITPQTSFDIAMSSVDHCAPLPSTTIPSRPKLKRRDTPRPASTLSSLSSIEKASPREDKHRGKRRLTSMIDGGSWVVLE